jgi:hypothetical protein
MQAQIKNSINRFGITFLALLAAFVWVVGCAASKPAPDPLAGWKILFSRDYEKLNKAITDDYRDYIQKLPPAEKYYVMESDIWFYEDGTGQHAIRIEIPLNGTWWSHVLIYDKNDKRIKTIKYASGGYRS